MRRGRLLLAALSLQFLAIGAVEAWRDAPTVDEVIDVSAGATGLARRDLRLLPEHGVLARVAVGAPALLARPVLPEGEGYRTGDWFLHTEEFVDANEEAGRLTATIRWSRLASLLVGLAVGLVLYVLGRRRAGEWAGLAAAGAWLTTPIVIGFSHVAMVDVPFALAFVVVALALDADARRPDDRSAAVVGAAVGAALLTRHLALILVPVAIGVVVLHAPGGWNRVRRTVLAGGAAWALVWAVFLLLDPTPPSGPAGDRLGHLVTIARNAELPVRVAMGVPWPEQWAAGLGFLSLTTEGRAAYLAGQSWTGGRWWFFPASMALRTTVVVVGLLAAGLVALRPTRGWGPALRSAAPVAAPALGLLAVLAVQPSNLGVRVALPVLALGILGGAEALSRLRATARRRIVVGGAALQVLSLVVALPGTIGATTAGPVGPSPYQVAADVDIGQDLDRWRDRADDLEPPPLEALLAPLGRRDEFSSNLVGRDPATIRGWVAVSAANLTTFLVDELAWLRAYCPVDGVGRSVVLYRFDVPPDAAPGPERPVGPCTERTFSERRG